MRVVIVAVLVAVFAGCTSYDQTAALHSQSNENIGTHVTKKVFTMPNGKTYMMLSSNYRFGGGALEVVEVKGQKVGAHDFEKSGGLMNLNFDDSEKAVKIGDSVYHCSVREIDGKKYYQFRVHRKVALVPLG